MIARLLGKRIFVLNVPLGLGVLVAWIIKVITFGRIDLVEKVQRMAEDRSYSHEEATKDFGYQPEKFEDGLAREVKEYLLKKM